MYAKYQTEAIVLSAYPAGEADKVFVLMTREFGLVRARASAVRAHYSRMRYSLQLYTHCDVSLVRGARGWRVTGASARRGVAHASREEVAAFARIGRLVERLVTGEEKHEELFNLLHSTHAQLCTGACAFWSVVEVARVAQILHILGYLSKDALSAAGIDDVQAEREISLEEAHRSSLISAINQALSVTHL